MTQTDSARAPERIWMDPDIKFPECEKQYGCDVEYIRADLATKPDPLADPRVTALVNLIRQAQGIIDPCYPAKHAAWQNATRATLAAFNTGGKDDTDR